MSLCSCLVLLCGCCMSFCCWLVFLVVLCYFVVFIYEFFNILSISLWSSCVILSCVFENILCLRSFCLFVIALCLSPLHLCVSLVNSLYGKCSVLYLFCVFYVFLDHISAIVCCDRFVVVLCVLQSFCVSAWRLMGPSSKPSMVCVWHDHTLADLKKEL